MREEKRGTGRDDRPIIQNLLSINENFQHLELSIQMSNHAKVRILRDIRYARSTACLIESKFLFSQNQQQASIEQQIRIGIPPKDTTELHVACKEIENDEFSSTTFPRDEVPSTRLISELHMGECYWSSNMFSVNFPMYEGRLIDKDWLNKALAQG